MLVNTPVGPSTSTSMYGVGWKGSGGRGTADVLLYVVHALSCPVLSHVSQLQPSIHPSIHQSSASQHHCSRALRITITTLQRRER